MILRISCALLAAAAIVCAQAASAPLAPADPAPPASEQHEMLARITSGALRYQGEVPDFLCEELITRSEANTKAPDRWKELDTLEEELGFVGGKETHTLLKINGKATHTSHEELEGMRSDGLLQFVMVPGWIFGPHVNTRFDWSRWETRAGRRVAVFSFQVPPSVSTHPLANEEKSFLVGYHGLIFADPATGDMARLEAAMDPPKDFPFQEDAFEIDYGQVDIAGQQFLLPVNSVGWVREGKTLTRNDIEIGQYRKYGAAATVTFGAGKP
ncbi:MAG TPA: hypothetical protein VGG72_26700 [Bryobacteraceae bacterium]